MHSSGFFGLSGELEIKVNEMNHLEEKVKSTFSGLYDDECILIKSPGRVNLIGGHTDYNDGFTLPLAIDKSIVLAMAPNNTGQLNCYSVDKEEYYEADLQKDLQKSGMGWPDFLLGVADRLKKHGYSVEGFNCVFSGDVPIGAGLSSSAALEGGVLFGLDQLFGYEIPSVEMAKIAQEAENKFVGVQCGIMDQFISLNGKKNRAMKLDCRSLEYEFYPFYNNGARIVLCDTQIRRELASSEYNVRRRQCEQGAAILQEYDPFVKSLRDVSRSLLEHHREAMDPVIYKRCRYIIEENKRVLASCVDLQNNDLKSFGQHLYAAHAGLRDEFEVSCRELDVLVEAAKQIDGAFGARMMGGGFGGCTINLVDVSGVQEFCDEIQKAYAEKVGQEITIYETKVSEGTHLVESK
jgi:galactokinase